MKNRVKRVINFRFDRYKTLEAKLEKFAAKGLVLEKFGMLFWTFIKGEPQSLKYAVTYFAEGSMFNPGITENQQTYIEYAKAAGWELVTQLNQTQIFCTKADNPVPFETDEREKLKNIKKCMKKSFLPSTILLMVVFIFNMAVPFNSLAADPIGFLSDANQLISLSVIFAAILVFGYWLIDYLLWCRRAEQSIDDGGICIENASKARQIIDTTFICYAFICLGWLLLSAAEGGNWFGLIIGMVQIPILVFVYLSTIKYLKKKKAAALLNKIISVAVLSIASFAYLALIVTVVIRFGLYTESKSDYRTVRWQLTATESHDYRLYSDELPLTCEDLYGQTDYDYYSREKNVDSTIFLAVDSYSQDSLPARDSPPRLEYKILKPRIGFVYGMAREQLLEIPTWRDNYSLQVMDNAIFGTVEAYQGCYGGINPNGSYVLFFDDKIITLEMEDPPTPAQIAVIKEKLTL